MTKGLTLTLLFLCCSLLLRSQSDASYKIKTGYLVNVHEKTKPLKIDSNNVIPWGSRIHKAKPFEIDSINMISGGSGGGHIPCSDFLFSTKKLNLLQCSDLKTIYENCEGFVNTSLWIRHIMLEDSSKLSKLTDDFFDSLSVIKPITVFDDIEIVQTPVTIIYKNSPISSSYESYFSCSVGLVFISNSINVYQVEYMFSPY